MRYGDRRPPVQPLRVASVIAGQLRGITNRTNVARVNWLTRQSDVFICTDRLYQAQIGNLTGVVGTRFIEEDPSWKEKVNLTKELQWWRLQQCWDMIQDFAAEHGFSYAFYMKIRTDCYKRGGCEPSWKTYNKVQRLWPTPGRQHLCRGLRVQHLENKLFYDFLQSMLCTVGLQIRRARFRVLKQRILINPGMIHLAFVLLKS